MLPIDKNTNKLERSYGANIDFNYKTIFGETVTFSINQLFFYTYLDNPLLLQNIATNTYQFINSSGYIHTKGTETNIKIGYEDFKLFLGYTFTDTRLHQNGVSTNTPLTPKHRINSVLMYEIEDKWKVGLEAYYFSPQKLSDGTVYWDAIVMDITEKSDLEELANRTAKMARVGSWEWNLFQDANEKMYWSPMAREIFEVDKDYDPTLSGGFEFYADECKNKIKSATEKLIEKGDEFDVELLVTTYMGNPRWVRCIGRSDRRGGKCTKIYGSFQDIHSQKINELELAKRNELLAVITNIIGTFLQVENWFDALKQVFELCVFSSKYFLLKC